MKKPYITFLTIILLITISYFVINDTGIDQLLQDSNYLKKQILSLGLLGPLLVIALMTVAIVMSPLPSAPIALVSGALYGHAWGTLYVLIGSTLGAFIAFFIARLLGHDILMRWFGSKLAMKWINSQNTLMGVIFFSRLMPFVSFDIMSYAAGLTAIKFWRFAIATIAGIAPASFLLAHFGDELSSAESQRITVTIVVLGIIAILPFIIRFLKNIKKLP